MKKRPVTRTANTRSANASDVAIGKRVRQRRLEQKISQAELGEHLGISFQQIQKYEKGVNRVGAGRLLQLSKALDCEVGFFLPADDRPKADSVLDRFVTTKDGIRIANAFVRIADADVRHMIARFIDDLSRTPPRAMQAAE